MNKCRLINLLDKYINKIGMEHNILSGNLLDDSVKSFLHSNSNAFLVGLIADQSVRAEIAWSLPYRLCERVGTFDIEKIVELYTESDIEKYIKEKPSLHRYPSRMANYIYNAIKIVVDEYDGDAKNIWDNKSAEEIVNNLEKFKGISHKKASLGTLLLVRDMGLVVEDKENIDIAYDVHIKRIFGRVGLVDEETEENVLKAARELKPEFPGKLTTAFWSIGRDYCHANNPMCLKCPISSECDKKIK